MFGHAWRDVAAPVVVELLLLVVLHPPQVLGLPVFPRGMAIFLHHLAAAAPVLSLHTHLVHAGRGIRIRLLLFERVLLPVTNR